MRLLIVIGLLTLVADSAVNHDTIRRPERKKDLIFKQRVMEQDLDTIRLDIKELLIKFDSIKRK